MRGIPVVLALLLLGQGGGCAARQGGAGDPSQALRAEVARRARVEEDGRPADGSPDEAVARLLAQPLDEDAAVKIALLAHPAVREAYERLGIARAGLLQAGLLGNPVFAIGAKAFTQGPEVELGLAQPFLDLFLVPMRRRIAGARLRAEECAVVRELVHLAYEVRRSFVRLRAADDAATLRAEALLRAAASRDLMLRLHAAGNVVDMARSLEEADAARAQLDVDDARAKAQDAREQLALLLGLGASGAAWTLAPVPALPAVPAAARPSPADAQEQAEAASLDLRESRARIDAARQDAGLVRIEGGALDPSLGVLGKREAAGAWGWGPSASATIPLFDTGQARRAAAAALLRQELARHDRLRGEVRSAARRLGARLEAFEARARYLREAYLPLRERMVREVLQSYNAMQVGASDVLRAKRQQLDAQRELVETEGEAVLARLDLQELLAGSLGRERLERPVLPGAAEHPVLPGGH